MRALVWFRRDLRIQDNNALAEAARSSTQGVVGVFLLAPAQWLEHDDSPCKVRFWLDNLRVLSASLAKLNIPLILEEAPKFEHAASKLLAVARSSRCSALFFNQEYEVNERRRDEAVTQRFTEAGLVVATFHDRVILAPEEVKTKEGKPYSVFSPYRRAWISRVRDSEVHVLETPMAQPPTGLESSEVPSTLKGFERSPRLHDHWPPGEPAAQDRLRSFVNGALNSYDELRDIPGIIGTSGLSPYLAAGVLSPRQCLVAAMSANHGQIDSGSDGVVTWISELVWREFYVHVLVGFPWVSMNLGFRRHTERLPWGSDVDALAAWQDGRTGFPIVDAAMRQLLHMGWMHNRLRMISAMFLSKHLFLDWRLGERHFMRHLIDGDLAANNGGWQWSASTGTDAVPYFRIFNPWSQSKRFDPDGAFIRQFCPELAAIDASVLHDPRRLSALHRIAIDYPPPMVNHQEARQRAIRAFETIRP